MKEKKEYLEYLSNRKKYSNNTVLGYEEDIDFFLEFLNREKIDILRVDYNTIRKFYNYRLVSKVY